jgi:hypothetical protein
LVELAEELDPEPEDLAGAEVVDPEEHAAKIAPSTIASTTPYRRPAMARRPDFDRKFRFLM